MKISQDPEAITTVARNISAGNTFYHQGRLFIMCLDGMPAVNFSCVDLETGRLVGFSGLETVKPVKATVVMEEKQK